MRRLASSAVIMVLVTGVVALPRAQTPYSPGEVHTAATNVAPKKCGLVATTAGDPDWVVATSDRIFSYGRCLASPPCAATAWYDKIFEPCYPDNRYWKFEPNSGSAFAFPMAAFGVGTFDGLFIRRNIPFQLYQGADDSQPYGPLMHGPRFVTETYWRDGNPACNGFEPGTYLVEGGPGALSDYSLKVGGDVSITDLDLREDDNKRNLHTDRYEDRFVLRRASVTEFDLKLSDAYGPGCHEVYLHAEHSFDGDATTIEIREFDDPVPPTQWGVHVKSITRNADHTKTLRLELNIPPDAAVGKYAFKALVRERNDQTLQEPDDERNFPEDVVIVFNPWSSTDTAGGSPAPEEYVLAENGVLWLDSSAGMVTRTWRYAQFEAHTLDLALELLDGQNSALRKDPVKLSRFFSAITNSNDGGVLTGNWSGSYFPYTDPSSWTGSDELVAAYGGLFSDDVRYGQCWVFGGLLTTFLRSLGIAARPLTNYDSAHDANGNKDIDVYLDATFHRLPESESIWNFHVWCDAWINGGWNAVDATPQERSDGLYQMGPAPVTSVRANAGGQYDVDFVFAEVDGNEVTWLKKNGTTTKLSTDTDAVGHNISTKAVNAPDREDITASYKSTSKSGGPSNKATLPVSGIDIVVTHTASLAVGATAVLTVDLHNGSSEAREVQTTIRATSISYNGVTLGPLGDRVQLTELAPGATASVALEISPELYRPMLAATRTIEFVWGVEVPGTSDVLAGTRRTVLSLPPLSLTATPDTTVARGQAVSVRTLWTNATGGALTQTLVTYHVGAGLSIGGASQATIEVGDVAAGAAVDVTRTILATGTGERVVSVELRAAELSPVVGSIQLVVVEDCNHNGVADASDVASGASADCNHDLIPDECEIDCNANGLPDDCDIAAGFPDCNGNHIPDGCDISNGAPDVNQNGVPDTCDPDCNANGVPDDYEIMTGMASDANHNGLPDVCDVDCNENGIADELDIARGTSADTNLNGVPDECEIRNRAPSADAGPAQTIECTGNLHATATLDGSRSTDPDSSSGTNDDIVTFTWTEGSVTLGSAAIIDLPFAIGEHPVTLRVVDHAGASDSAGTTVTVRDTVRPAGRITFPSANACFGPTSVPVVITDDCADSCDPNLTRSYVPAGPAYREHGDVAVVLTVADGSGNALALQSAFTIDLEAPRVSLLIGRDWTFGSFMPFNHLFADSDDDGARGGVVREVVAVDGCIVYDGASYGNADGLLLDESAPATEDELCRLARLCGAHKWTNPVVSVTVTDCGSNTATATKVIPGTFVPTSKCH